MEKLNHYTYLNGIKKIVLGVMLCAFVVLAGVLVFTETADAYTFTQFMRIGSTGPEVMALQQTLNTTTCKVAASGAGSPGLETQYFGPLTNAAVHCFQTSRGLLVDGVVGPQTRAALNTLPGSTTNLPPGCQPGYLFSVSTGLSCMSVNLPPGCQPGYEFSATTGQSCTNPSLPPGCQPGYLFSVSTGLSCTTDLDDIDENDPLRGGAGSVNSYNLVAGLSNEEIGEGQNDVEVAGLEIEASGDSDLRITALRLDFDQVTANNDDFDDYADDVSVWFKGKEVARVDANKFDEGNNYSRILSLDSGVIIRMDDTEELIVAISGANNIDSSDTGESWNVDFQQVRYEDATGTSITENPGTASRTFSFEEFATAANTELRIASNDDDVNNAHILQLDDSSETDDVPLLSFTIEIEGDSDVLLDELPVEFDYTPNGTGHLDDVITFVHLVMDGSKVGTEAMTDAGSDDNETIIFGDLDLNLKAGETYQFLVTADFEEIDGTVVMQGDTIAANIGSTERNNIDAEDESGGQLSNNDKTGTVAGEAHGIFYEGIIAEFVGSSYIKNSSSTTGVNETVQFTLEFNITAFGDDIWVDKSCVVGTTGTDVDALEVSLDSDTNGDNTTCTDLASNAPEGTYGFRILENQTRNFEVSILGDGGEAGNAGSSVTFRARINGIGYNVGSDAQGDTVYTFGLEDFKSGAVTVFDR